MQDLISRQAAIDALDCINGVEEVLRALPSEKPENQVHLCDSCRHVYPECPIEKDDVIFGNGKGNDNICACNKYEQSAQPEQRWIPFKSKLPEDGQRILITVNFFGREKVQADEFYIAADGAYLYGMYEIGTEAVAWMPFPEPYKEGDK